MITEGDLLSLVRGDLSPRARVVTALLPVLIASGYFIAGLVAFTFLVLLRGNFRRDPEIEARGVSFLVGSYLRHYFFWIITPLWRLVLATGIPPVAVTTLAALFGAGAGVAVAAGRFALGGWLFLLSGTLDIIDGRLARARNQVTPAGAAIDSVLDRYTDSMMLLGLAWYYRQTWVLFPVLLAIVGTSLVPYIRAKGEALGSPIRSGLMQRPERIVVLGVSVALSPIFDALMFPTDTRPHHWIAVGALVFLATTSNATAIGRFLHLVRALRGPTSPRLTRFAPMTLAAGAATVIDYVFVTGLLGVSDMSLAAATASGCLIGAVANFSMNRVWASRSPGAPLLQIGRYSLVSFASMLLNSGAVALLSLHFELHHAWIWWPARGVVFVLWNLPLQRDYVFTADPVSAPARG